MEDHLDLNPEMLWVRIPSEIQYYIINKCSCRQMEDHSDLESEMLWVRVPLGVLGS